MVKSRYTYKLSWILPALVTWEILFWLLGWFLLHLFQFDSDYASEKIVFISPENAIYLLLLPLYWVFFFMRIAQRNRYVNGLADAHLARTFLRPISSGLTFLRYFLIRNSLVLLVLAAMQPSYGSKTVSGRVSAVEMVFVVDLSQSMNVQDMSGGKSRLEVAQRAMHQLINQTSSAKVGMLVFAGSVFPQLPLTADKYAAKMYIDELSTDIISNQGTNIGLALSKGIDFFSEEKMKKVLVLITDGEDHEGGVNQAIRQLKDSEIELVVLGLGTTAGGLVPNDPKSGVSGYVKDASGRPAKSKLNPEMLQEIAAQANGAIVISSDAFPNLSPLLTQINNLKTTKQVDLEFEIKENRYRIPLAIGLFFLLLLLVVDIVVLFRKSAE